MAQETNSVICPICKAETHRYPVTGNVECYTRGCPMRGVEMERRIMAGLSYCPPSDVPTRPIRIAVAYFDDGLEWEDSTAISAGGDEGDSVAIDCLLAEYAGVRPRFAFITAQLPIGKPVEVEGTVDA